MKKRIMVPIIVIGLLLTTSAMTVNAQINPYQREIAIDDPIYVDDDADPDWYDDTHVKTIKEGIEVAEDGEINPIPYEGGCVIGDGFNLAVPNIISWFSYERDDPSISFLCYQYLEINIGETYIIEEPFWVNTTVWVIHSDGTREFIWGRWTQYAPTGDPERDRWLSGVGWYYGHWWYPWWPNDELPLLLRVEIECTAPESNKDDNIVNVKILDGVTIEGKVSNEYGFPLKDAIVSCAVDESHFWHSYYDDIPINIYGYSYPAPPKPPFDEPQTYDITVRKDGYKNKTKTTNLVNAGEITTLNFELTKEKSKIRMDTLMEKILNLMENNQNNDLANGDQQTSESGSINNIVYKRGNLGDTIMVGIDKYEIYGGNKLDPVVHNILGGDLVNNDFSTGSTTASQQTSKSESTNNNQQPGNSQPLFQLLQRFFKCFNSDQPTPLFLRILERLAETFPYC